VKNEVTLAVIALVLVATPVRSAKRNDLPQGCVNADFTHTGRPVMFPLRDGLSMGISTSRPTLEVSDPAVIYVWVNNQTDNQKILMSCAMWWDWGVAVYDAGWHVMKTRLEQEQENRHTLEQAKICGRNLQLRIPPHSCGPLQDMGDVRIDLRKERDLPPGNYFVTEKALTPPLLGLRIAIVDNNNRP
jgi:hypothetical protein